MSESIGDYIEANRKNWDDRVPIHLSSPTAYDVDGFIGDPEKLSFTVRFDLQHLPDVRGKSMLHLMCHIGLDTLSWARLGADAMGIDFSGESIRVAAETAERAGLNVRFAQSNVYEARTAVEGEFDVVYMSSGVLMWLPDIDRLSGVVASLLKPGGLFHLTEIHPLALALDLPSADGSLRIVRPYLGSGEPFVEESEESYVQGEGAIEHATSYQWAHGLGEVANAFTRHGMRLSLLREYPFGGFPPGAPLVRRADGWHEYPPDPNMTPLMYTLQAVKDG